MPWGDRTGPAGLGPMTGRRMGYCAGFNMPGFMNPGFGFGRRRGRGRGFWWRGWRHWGPFWGGPFWAWNPPIWASEPEAEKDMLKNQAKILEQELAEIKKRIDELEAKKEV